MYPGPNTLLRRGLSDRSTRAVVMHEGMHHAGYVPEWAAWEPV